MERSFSPLRKENRKLKSAIASFCVDCFYPQEFLNQNGLKKKKCPNKDCQLYDFCPFPYQPQRAISKTYRGGSGKKIINSIDQI